MKIECWYIGKTSEAYLQEGCKIFETRVKRFLPFETSLIQNVKSTKNSKGDQIKKLEAQKILSKLNSDDYLILLDERGKEYSSRQLAEQLNKWMLLSQRRVIFLIGGAFGFDQSIYDRANAKLSLSKLTFSHQMIRLFFLEQLYRAMSILKNQPYHND